MPKKLDDAQREHLQSFKLFTPKFVWILFAVIEFVTFFDRGVIAGALQQIRQDSSISGGKGQILDGTKSGLLTSMFITGFLIFSPIFTALAGRFSSRILLVVGCVLWLFSVILSGAAPNYGVLVFARCITGIGEAAYTPFMVTTLDNIAPVKSRTLWIGIWYSMIAFGTAFGMGVGAIVASKVELPDGTPGWRLLFYLETIFGAAFTVLLFMMPSEYDIYDLEDTKKENNKIETANTDETAGVKDDADDQEKDQHVSIVVAVKEILLNNADFNIIGFGYGLYNWITGAAASWLVQTMSQSSLNLSQSHAGMIVGGMMAFCGIFGSAVGGLLVDKYAPVTHPQSVTRSTFFAAMCMLIAFPLSAAAILSQELWLFIVAFLPAIFLLFALVPAITVALLGVVPSHLRPYSISIAMIYQHALGDAISPTVAGALSSQFGSLCDSVTENMCDMLNFDNSTFDEQHDWLDGECRWIKAEHPGDSPYCTNTMQLNKGLVITLCVSAISIPFWLYVSLKRKCCQIQGEADILGASVAKSDDEQYLKKNLLREADHQRGVLNDGEGRGVTIPSSTNPPTRTKNDTNDYGSLE